MLTTSLVAGIWEMGSEVEGYRLMEAGCRRCRRPVVLCWAQSVPSQMAGCERRARNLIRHIRAAVPGGLACGPFRRPPGKGR